MKRTSVIKKGHMLFEEIAIQKILNTIFSFPEVEFSLRELALKAGTSASTASRLLKRLLDYQIITIEDKKIVFRIRANIASFEYLKRKIVHNLNLIYQSGLVEFLDEALGHPPAIILFGSLRKGDDISTSDIDIAVETHEGIDTEIIRPKGVEKFEEFFNKKINILQFNRTKTNLNVFNSIANGIVLYGFLEVKP